MPEKIKTGIYVLILTTLLIITTELISTIVFTLTIRKNKIPFKKDDFISILANEDRENFLSNEYKAVEHQFLKITSRLFSFTITFALCFMILNTNIQNNIRKCISKIYSPVKSGFRDLSPEEINLTTAVITYILLTSLIFDIIFKTVSILSVVVWLFVIILLYLFLIPIFLFLGSMLFQTFGAKLIIAAYFSWIFITAFEFISLEPVDTETMTKLDINIFPDIVIQKLHKYNLQDHVYIEKKPSKETNAALVGYGKNKRIEIYGGLSKGNHEGLDGVILHEIGHAEDNSLIKKAIVYISLIITEMFIVLAIYAIAAPKFANSTISAYTYCILLFLIYYLIFKPFLFMIFKLVSQVCEIKSDNFAKKNGYGNQLGETLYDIVVEGKEYIKPTAIFTMFSSTHPAIGDRINSLKTKD